MTAASLAGPLEATLERLRALDPWSVAEVGRPEGDAWYALDDMVADGHLDAWLASLVTEHGGRRDVAGTYLGSWLAATLVEVPMAAILTERRLPDLRAGLWLHRHQEGWFDRVAFASCSLTVVAGDADADHPHTTVVADRASVWDRYALTLVEVLSPLLWALRQRVPYGMRGLWGAVADDVAGRALRIARLTGGDGWGDWSEARVILDRIAVYQDHLRTRPSPFPVTWSGGDTLFQVKGTCCLYYKTQEAPDPRGEGYCTSCPFREDESRTERCGAISNTTTRHDACPSATRSVRRRHPPPHVGRHGSAPSLIVHEGSDRHSSLARPP